MSPKGTHANGWTAPGFEPVQVAFERNFEVDGEVGAAFAAYHRGRKVVDLWGGTADVTNGAPWQEDTIVLVYSTTKGVTAMCANRLAQEGLLDMGAPVAEYWPEFAQAGKEAVTVTDLLSHRAGVAWIDGTMSTADALAWEPVIRALEGQAPSWVPGTDHGYHATTYGWLVGEVIRRVSGKSVGTYLRDAITAPLGASFFVGLPASEHARPARLVSFIDALASGRIDASGADGPGDAEMIERAKTYLAPGGPLMLALGAPGGALSDQKIWDSPELWSAEIPAANGMCDARSLAALYGACVGEIHLPDGGSYRLLSAEQLDQALVQQTQGPDRVLLGLDLQWGLGFMLNRGIIAESGMGGPRTFGHYGMGGSVGWADPDLGLGMGYVMNRMSLGMAGDKRSHRLITATLEAARTLDG
ncbi:MAG: serine hydrolase [Actinomycetota bacterium]|jgi:CubicO group peptidase (beta-lactamase class C family)|nr:serine hydrolase [Actinomycetota bacterium]